MLSDGSWARRSTVGNSTAYTYIPRSYLFAKLNRVLLLESLLALRSQKDRLLYSAPSTLQKPTLVSSARARW